MGQGAAYLELDSVATLRCSHDRGRRGGDESGENTKVISVDHDGVGWDGMGWFDQRYQLGELGVGYLRLLS